MSSLWTPGGEVPVSRSGGRDEPAGRTREPDPRVESDDDPGSVLGGVNLDDLSPEERAQAEEIMAEMAETQRRLAAMAAADVVANHAMGMYELAAIHLSQPTPQLDDAKVAIDALAAIVDAVGERFGENLAVLRQALSNLQMAFVEITSAGAAPSPGDPNGT